MSRIAFVAAILLFCVGLKPASAADDAATSMSEALTWIKQTDGQLTKPRYSDLTLEQLKTMTDFQLGGHRKSDKKHLLVPPKEFRHLASLPAVTKLHLGENNGVTDEALAHVGKLTDLKELILWDAPMTDAGLKHLVNLKGLTNLDLAFATKITTAALDDIVQLSNLERLSLSGTKVDDVSSLTKLPKLQVLQLGKLKPKGLEELLKANPKLMIK